MLSLVLKISGGNTFVVNQANRFKIRLTAKCHDLDPNLLQSQVEQLNPGRRDIDFESKLTWIITPEQLKKARSRQSAIKVTCIVIDNKFGTELEEEGGYVILNIRDVVDLSFGAGRENPKTYPLLGTKGNWQSFRPTIVLSLYLETVYIRRPRLHLPIQAEPGNQENFPPLALPREELVQVAPILNNNKNDRNLAAEVVVPVAADIGTPQQNSSDVPLRSNENNQVWTRGRQETIQTPNNSDAEASSISDENNVVVVNPAQICEPAEITQHENVDDATGYDEQTWNTVLVRSDQHFPFVTNLEGGSQCLYF